MEQKKYIIKRARIKRKKMGKNPTKNPNIHPLCIEAGCLKYSSDRRCSAFDDPAYQWKKFYTNGSPCWGLCQDFEKLEEIFEAIEFKFKREHGEIKNTNVGALNEIKNCILYHTMRTEK